jgi:cation transport regulator ChaB
MFRNDMTGLVDVLTDFAVQSASVSYRIEAENDQLDEVLNNWLNTINAPYGTIPMGIKALAKEYMQERWKYSSFCVLQIAHWKKDPTTNLLLPDQMIFVDGGSIHALEKDKNTDVLTVDSWSYYIGKDSENKITPGTHIVNRPYCRWFDKYPIPYTIKRGVYYNYKIIESLKKKEIEVLDQIIPYMLLVQKGTEGLALNQQKTYSQPELQEVVNQFQQLYENLRVMHLDDKQVKTPMRVTNFDEEIKHLIPDLKTLFQAELFEQAERNILSGLGFIDIVQGVVSNRRESVLNPKAFIQEINSAIEDFKHILNTLLYLIAEKNDSHIKYNASKLYISSSPVRSFMTDEFKEKLRTLYDRGLLSKRTFVELVGEGDYETEKFRREKEEKSGDSITMYPPITQNQEGKGIDIQGTNTEVIPPTATNKDGKETLQDRTGTETQNWNYSAFEEEDNDVITAEIVNFDSDELELARKSGVRITENYLRYRQKDPKQFDDKSFRTIVLSPSKHIKAIIGKIKGQKTTTIQSYLFDKNTWKQSEAKTWVGENHPAYAKTASENDLVTAPYTSLNSLPPAIKKMSEEKQKVFRGAFNGAFRYMMAKGKPIKAVEQYAFRVAYSAVRKSGLAKSNLSLWERLAGKFKGKK